MCFWEGWGEVNNRLLRIPFVCDIGYVARAVQPKIADFKSLSKPSLDTKYRVKHFVRREAVNQPDTCSVCQNVCF